MKLKTAALLTFALLLAAGPLVGPLVIIQGTSGQWAPIGNYDASAVIAYSPDADRYIAVRADCQVNGADMDILGAVIQPGGGLEGNPLLINGDLGTARHPALAWNPALRQFLVASDVDGSIMIQFTDAYGVPAFPSFANVASGRQPGVTCDGRRWLVTWRTNGQTNSIMGCFVDAAGVGAAFPIYLSNTQFAACAFGAGANFLVAWRAGAGTYSRTVTPSGALGAVQRLDAGNTTVLEGLAITANPTDHSFLVGWVEWDLYNGTGDPVVRIVDAAGLAPAPPIAIEPGIHHSPLSLALAWNDELDEYAAAWITDRDEDGNLDSIVLAQLDGLRGEVITSAMVVAALPFRNNPQYQLSFQYVSLASRQGTRDVAVLWRRSEDSVSLTVEAQQVELINRLPLDPTGIEQSHSPAGAAFVPVDPSAGTFTGPPPPDGRMMTFRCGPTSDPDVADRTGLEVECTRISDGRSFRATQPRPAASGAAGLVTVGPLPNGPYRWRARVVDYHGSSGSSWIAYSPSSARAFEIDIPNQRPPVPAALTQADPTGAAIPAGGSAPGLVTISADLPADVDGDPQRLEVEIRPIGVAFTGEAMLLSDFGPAGVHRVSFKVEPNSACHWQAWSRDGSGASNDSSAAVAFGSNGDAPPADPDFSRGANLASALPPSGLGQFSATSGRAIRIGGTADGRGLVFKASVNDADFDRCALRVEVRRVGEAFDGTATAIGSMVDSGGISVAELAGADYGPCHWQAWIADEYGVVSSVQASFGNNTDDETDFEIPAGGSAGLSACSSSAGFRSGFAFLAAIAAFRRKFAR